MILESAHDASSPQARANDEAQRALAAELGRGEAEVCVACGVERCRTVRGVSDVLAAYGEFDRREPGWIKVALDPTT